MEKRSLHEVKGHLSSFLTPYVGQKGILKLFKEAFDRI
jgi:hypothetical protein